MTGTIVTDPRPLSGGLLAFGRSLAAEGEARNVLTNLLLPYALTQMTDDGMPSAARRRMDPDRVAPVLTALASPGQLHALLAESGSGKPREFRVAVDAFDDLAGEAE